MEHGYIFNSIILCGLFQIIASTIIYSHDSLKHFKLIVMLKGLAIIAIGFMLYFILLNTKDNYCFLAGQIPNLVVIIDIFITLHRVGVRQDKRDEAYKIKKLI